MWKEVESREADKTGMEEVRGERRKKKDEKTNREGEYNSKDNSRKGR